MTMPSLRLVSAAAFLAVVLAVPSALAQQEYAPPQGNGHLVVLISGIGGPGHMKELARAVADLGYDVVVFDGTKLEGKRTAGLKACIEQAKQMPHALPGKVALVGVSLGGGIALTYGALMEDDVAVDIVWYPATGVFVKLPKLARHFKVPVLMFAGESDTFRNCCLIDTAHTIETNAKEGKAPFDLVTYPNTDHDFIVGGTNYNAKSYKDAFDRTAARLKETFRE